MNPLTDLVIQGGHILGQALLHSLWQGAALALLLTLGLHLLPKTAHRQRILLAQTGLYLLGASFVFTLWYLSPEASLTGATNLSDPTPVIALTEPPMEIWLPDTSILSGEWFLALSLLWLLGYCLVLTRMWLGWRQLQTWRQQAKKSSPPQEWAAFLDRARHQLGIQRTPLFGTLEDIPSPLTFGWWKPVILLPVGLINQLTPQEVEAILWHELSHVRRQDYLWQTLQLLLTRFFYYHPLIWWLDRFLVDEREMATDQLALTWAPDRTGYARALVHATEWGMRQEQLSLAARGRPGQLTHRIQQILNRNSTKQR